MQRDCLLVSRADGASWVDVPLRAHILLRAHIPLRVGVLLRAGVHLRAGVLLWVNPFKGVRQGGNNYH